MCQSLLNPTLAHGNTSLRACKSAIMPWVLGSIALWWTGCSGTFKANEFHQQLAEIRSVGIAEPDIFLERLEDDSLVIDLDGQVGLKGDLRDWLASGLAPRCSAEVLPNFINDPTGRYRKEVERLFTGLAKGPRSERMKLSDTLSAFLELFPHHRHFLMSRVWGFTPTPPGSSASIPIRSWHGIPGPWKAGTPPQVRIQVALVDRQARQIVYFDQFNGKISPDESEFLSARVGKLIAPLLPLGP